MQLTAHAPYPRGESFARRHRRPQPFWFSPELPLDVHGTPRFSVEGFVAQCPVTSSSGHEDRDGGQSGKREGQQP
ncbi:hypothetical protein [Kocuria kalidii]|uniref:hypothetical protein n=1 Tax=Kocuria kalidii TaxID=3376283 RepID=UPI0037AF7DF2